MAIFLIVGKTWDSRGLRLRPQNEACMWETKPQVHLRVIPTPQPAIYAVGTPKKDTRSSYSTRPKENLKAMKRMSLYHGPMTSVLDTHNLKEATKTSKHRPKGTPELGDGPHRLQGWTKWITTFPNAHLALREPDMVSELLAVLIQDC